MQVERIRVLADNIRVGDFLTDHGWRVSSAVTYGVGDGRIRHLMSRGGENSEVLDPHVSLTVEREVIRTGHTDAIEGADAAWPAKATLVRQRDDDTLYVRGDGEEPVDGEEAQLYVLCERDGGDS